MSNPIDQAPQLPPELLAQLAGGRPAAAGSSDLLEAAKSAEMSLSRLASVNPDMNGLVNDFIRAMRQRIVPLLGSGGAAPPPTPGAMNNASI